MFVTPFVAVATCAVAYASGVGSNLYVRGHFSAQSAGEKLGLCPHFI